jgi:hypothetical protein
VSGRPAYLPFRFYPRSEDLAQLRWLIGDSWGYARESGMLRNMLDASYVSAEASATGISSVGGIEFSSTAVDALGGEYEMHAALSVALMSGGSSGAGTDVRLDLPSRDVDGREPPDPGDARGLVGKLRRGRHLVGHLAGLVPHATPGPTRTLPRWLKPLRPRSPHATTKRTRRCWMTRSASFRRRRISPISPA